jgi:hypothetical protein
MHLIKKFLPPYSGYDTLKIFGQTVLELHSCSSPFSAQSFMKADVKYNQGIYLTGKLFQNFFH